MKIEKKQRLKWHSNLSILAAIVLATLCPGVRYGCSTAKKPSGPWYDLYFKQYDVPENARHGCMIPISQKQYDAIMAAYRD